MKDFTDPVKCHRGGKPWKTKTPRPADCHPESARRPEKPDPQTLPSSPRLKHETRPKVKPENRRGLRRTPRRGAIVDRAKMPADQ
jgi:hypothetical protein